MMSTFTFAQNRTLTGWGLATVASKSLVVSDVDLYELAFTSLTLDKETSITLVMNSSRDE